MVEIVMNSEIEFHKLGFEVGMTNEVCPYRTSCYYYSASLSHDDRYIAFYVDVDYNHPLDARTARKKREKNDKVVIWDTKKREVVNTFEITSSVTETGPFVYKIEFMPSKNYVVALCGRGGVFRQSIQIYSLDGELVKEIEFPSHIAYGKFVIGGEVLWYELMFNFAVSPDSKKIAISMQTRKVHKKGDSNIPRMSDAERMKRRPPVPYARVIYDIENDEVINLITEEDLRSLFGLRLRWPVDNAIVTSTIMLEDVEKMEKIEQRRYLRGKPVREQRSMTYATMINPYTGEVMHRAPVRYSNSTVSSPEPRLYVSRGMGYSGDAYFVRPDGEYIAIVNKYVDIARFSDFDAKGRHLKKGPKWQTVKEFRAHASNIEWSPNSSELIYQYRKSFVILNYEKNEVTRQILLQGVKKLDAVRIFWLRDDTIIFLNYGDAPDTVGVLKLHSI